jgi:hypothetical protein
VHPFCNLQSWARTYAVLVIGLYAGADPGFQVRGGALKKIIFFSIAEGGAKIFFNPSKNYWFSFNAFLGPGWLNELGRWI